MRAIPVLLLALFSVPLIAQSLEDFERVLIPGLASPEITGTNGARFAASAVLHAPVGTRYFPSYRLGADGSVIAEVGTVEHPVAYVGLLFRSPPSRVGRLLYIDRSHAGETVLSAFLSSREAGGTSEHRTRLPIVRESDFRSTTFSIIDVRSVYTYEGVACRKATPVYRHALRVYDFDGRGGTVRVRLVDEFVAGIITRDIMLDITSREGGDPSYPMYGELEIPELCHPFSCHTPCGGGSQRIEITPLTPSLRVWALVSETDNVTQETRLMYAE